MYRVNVSFVKQRGENGDYGGQYCSVNQSDLTLVIYLDIPCNVLVYGWPPELVGDSFMSRVYPSMTKTVMSVL